MRYQANRKVFLLISFKKNILIVPDSYHPYYLKKKEIIMQIQLETQGEAANDLNSNNDSSSSSDDEASQHALEEVHQCFLLMVPQKVLQAPFYYSVRFLPTLAMIPVTSTFCFSLQVMAEFSLSNLFGKGYHAMEYLLNKEKPATYLKEMGDEKISTGIIEVSSKWIMLSILPTFAGYGLSKLLPQQLTNLERVLINSLISCFLYEVQEKGIELLNIKRKNPNQSFKSFLNDIFYTKKNEFTTIKQDLMRYLFFRPIFCTLIFRGVVEAFKSYGFNELDNTSTYFTVISFDRMLQLIKQLIFVPRPLISLIHTWQRESVAVCTEASLRFKNDTVIAEEMPHEKIKAVVETLLIYGGRELTIWLVAGLLYLGWREINKSFSDMPMLETIALCYSFAMLPAFIERFTEIGALKANAFWQVEGSKWLNRFTFFKSDDTERTAFSQTSVRIYG
jgi:hypothetical protein